VFGPAIGGFVGAIHLSLPLYIAAAITLLDIIFGILILPESLQSEHKVQKLDFHHLNPFLQFNHIFSVKVLGRLFIMGFIFFVAMNAMYGNNSIFLKDVFSWNVTQIGMLLFVIGLVDIFTQGFLINKLLPKFGDVKVAILGLAIAICGFLIALSTTFFVFPALIYVGLIIINVGDGLFEPSQGSLISTSAGPHMQGRVQGANQGMQSIARTIGPFFAAWIYQYWRGFPYASEAILVVISLIIFVFSVSTIKAHKLAV